MAVFETWLAANLKEGQRVYQLAGNVFSQDKHGNLIGVKVMDGDDIATLTGTVEGSIIRADGVTIDVEGSLLGNEAYIILPEEAYAVVGAIQISIRLIDDDVKTTLAACTGYVHRTMTNTVLDEGGLYTIAIVPDLPTTDGTYTLKVTIQNGNETYFWG